MKQILNRVTITGADNSIEPEELFKLSNEFPFVEWGILFSRSREKTNRYPSYDWMLKLHHIWKEFYDNPVNYTRGPESSVAPARNYAFQLSGHICGQWVRDICQGHWSFLDDCCDIHEMFGRFQLNFHSQVHQLNHTLFLKGFDDPRLYWRQFIFQLDNWNNNILDVAKADDIDAVGLFDLSGGAGRLPETWPQAKGYCGYAGGLSPDNLQSQLELIEQVAGDGFIWIDTETRVRSEDDRIFDLGKVRAFLEAAKPWVDYTLLAGSMRLFEGWNPSNG